DADAGRRSLWRDGQRRGAGYGHRGAGLAAVLGGAAAPGAAGQAIALATRRIVGERCDRLGALGGHGTRDGGPGGPDGVAGRLAPRRPRGVRRLLWRR